MIDYTPEELHELEQAYAAGKIEGAEPRLPRAHAFYIELDRIADWTPIAGPFTTYTAARSLLDNLSHEGHKYRILVYPLSAQIVVDGAFLLQLLDSPF